jgi:outer membrane protein assembly factor BamD
MLQADAYRRMGDRFEDQVAAAYSKVVRDYPLSPSVPEATRQLKAMNRPVPEADPVAYAREKYELENRRKRSLMGKVLEPFTSSPDVLNAAKSGSPRMETLRPYTPVSIPASAKGGETTGGTGVSVGGGGSDVSVSTVNDSKLIDAAPDARQNAGAAPAPPAGAAATGTAAKPAVADPSRGPIPDASLPQNHTGKMTAADRAKLMKKQEELFKKKQQRNAKAQKQAEEEQARKNRKKSKATTAPPAPPPADAGGSTIKP